MSDIDMTQAEAQKVDAEIASLNAMTAKLHAETLKLTNEGKHLWVQTIVAPFLAAAAVIGATAAVVKLFF